MRTLWQVLMSTVLLGLAAVTAAAGDDRGMDSAGISFFETKVRPLLVKHCFECHTAAKQNGGLRLDLSSGWQTGGDSGPAVVPGKPGESRLIEAVGYQNADLKMPPPGRLADAEIAVLTKWVAMGAPDPRESADVKTAAVNLEEAQRHWAFQPIGNAPPPAVKDTLWPQTAVDHFILARLEAAELSPAAAADRYTWLRRVTLDLTGIPPTPEEIEAFVHDPSPQADARVVDRLLASPSFGERWSRHWLDLVGYADQIGTANDVYAEHAWRYRDYIIAAFNADKPFDEFIREQIAGDLMTAAKPDQRADQLIATGFLLLGNVDIVESDKAKLRADVVDQQIEKVGKTFLGLSLQCARCHDHKFDPIRLTDYYGLAGIFASTESVYETGQGIWSSITFKELPETPVQQAERDRRARGHAAALAAINSERAAAVRRREELAGQLKALPADADPAARASLEKEQKEIDGQIGQLDQRKQHTEFFAIRPPRTHAVHEKPWPADARIQIRGDVHNLGETVPRGFLAIATPGDAPALPPHQSGRLQLADWLVSPSNPLTARVLVNRTWQKLFGEGLVRSVDYFGLRGDTPSHTELLDHLATRFQREGWSQKRLLRELVLSRTYRISSTTSPRAAHVDPDNRLLGRMHRVRLDAESLRDSLLATSGTFLAGVGGPALPLEYVENVGNLSPTSVNPAYFKLKTFRPNQTHVRTVYLPVVRSMPQAGPADVLNFFDFAQPAQFVGQRPVTAAPTQALFLLNSPLVKSSSQELADRLLADSSRGDEARLSELWLRVLNRPISPEETQESLAYLATAREPGGPSESESVAARDLQAWARLCHALFVSNEFLFRL